MIQYRCVRCGELHGSPDLAFECCEIFRYEPVTRFECSECGDRFVHEEDAVGCCPGGGVSLEGVWFRCLECGREYPTEEEAADCCADIDTVVYFRCPTCGMESKAEDSFYDAIPDNMQVCQNVACDNFGKSNLHIPSSILDVPAGVMFRPDAPGQLTFADVG